MPPASLAAIDTSHERSFSRVAQAVEPAPRDGPGSGRRLVGEIQVPGHDERDPGHGVLVGGDDPGEGQLVARGCPLDERRRRSSFQLPDDGRHVPLMLRRAPGDSQGRPGRLGEPKITRRQGHVLTACGKDLTDLGGVCT